MPIIVPADSFYTLETLLAEFYLRGPDMLQDDLQGQTRATNWINSAYSDICDRAPWPFLEVSLDVTAPFEITDLKLIKSVRDTAAKVPLWGFEDASQLEQSYGDLEATGSPSWWYLEGNTLKTYPVSSNNLKVRYIAVPDPLSGPTDAPVIPNQYQDLIIDGALVWFYKDNDAFQKAQTLAQMYEAGIQRMTQSLLARNWASPPVQFQWAVDDA